MLFKFFYHSIAMGCTYSVASYVLARANNVEENV